MSFIAKFMSGGGATAAATATTRSVAKDRLSVILASQRGSELLEKVNMEDLQRDVLKVVERHIQIAKNRPVQFSVNAEGENQVFEMSVELAVARRSTAPRQAA
ncbi:Septum formation topological specificity factor MinE [Seminavis robusta]|uniref:Septum formation topological specificity factor MinE n=1 Tax=Seminavis robusta TaxID=568900 RepID=A0A9N8ETL7_9STRA|nr:Septum formation topological specificity factor MinE [Seminavis robusta]|eukprot:Sro1595_g284680.1 Septum formation topological specificity factor MinE (103) ;mRNA; r:12536-13000